MTNLYVEEDYTNLSEHCSAGSSGIYESCCETPSELYRECIKQFGRCTSKVYVDLEGKQVHVGWTFLKKEKYEDTHEPFLMETWITIHTAPETVTRTPHYFDIGAK